ncbi:membrane protein insertase YidC [Alloscardovia theropitheci]|uniref:Membrane protein insertase YidC n=1 Tax=Alloscardovia theropitheci TaxID=2496842 RepID=A0A4R0QPW5_9BIFI|nr:membrane protein insertase YidC [Alloscardovia theropitheci]TCD54293.1 membrane protein insertase YidC [Alloscardovia theropitheci]
MNLDQGFFGFIYRILYPLEWLMTQLMVIYHRIFEFLGMSSGPGFAWVLSIIFLTITVRLVILPFFVRQMTSMSRMQALQPQMQKIQNKYKGKTDAASREAQSRETMKLYQDNNVNPMGSCVPALIQGPVFMALFYILSAIQPIAEGKRADLGGFTKEIAQQIMHTEVFGTRISLNFGSASGTGKVIIGLFVAYMCITMFLSQYYSLRRNMPKESIGTQQYNTQRIMAFIFPVMYIFSGIAFPFAVLVYWATNNTWTLVQMIFQIENFPTPGSAAFESKKKRDYKREADRRERLGLPTIEEEELQKAKEEAEVIKKNGGNQRQQPSRKKNKR